MVTITDPELFAQGYAGRRIHVPKTAATPACFYRNSSMSVNGTSDTPARNKSGR